MAPRVVNRRGASSLSGSNGAVGSAAVVPQFFEQHEKYRALGEQAARNRDFPAAAENYLLSARAAREGNLGFDDSLRDKRREIGKEDLINTELKVNRLLSSGKYREAISAAIEGDMPIDKLQLVISTVKSKTNNLSNDENVIVAPEKFAYDKAMETKRYWLAEQIARTHQTDYFAINSALEHRSIKAHLNSKTRETQDIEYALRYFKEAKQYEEFISAAAEFNRPLKYISDIIREAASADHHGGQIRKALELLAFDKLVEFKRYDDAISFAQEARLGRAHELRAVELLFDESVAKGADEKAGILGLRYGIRYDEALSALERSRVRYVKLKEDGDKKTGRLTDDAISHIDNILKEAHRQE